MAQNHIIVLIFFVIFSPGIAISGFPGFPDAFGLHEQNQTTFSQENVTTLEPLEFTTIPGEIKEPGAETIEETTGPSTATTIEEDNDIEMELDLIRTGSSGPESQYFKVVNYTIFIEGQNATILKGYDRETDSNSISIVGDDLDLVSLGTLGIESTVEEGTTDTKIMPVYGHVDVDRVRENHRTNTTTYFLKNGVVTIGYISVSDYDGVTKDGAISGNLTVYPSEENPKKREGKLTLVGNE